MALVGLKMVRLALVDDNQQILTGDKGLSPTGLYEVAEKDLGSKQANITGLEGSTEKIYGNNQTMDTSVGAASPAVALVINNLDFEIRQKLLGNAPDGKGGYVYCGIKPHVALLVESTALKTKQSVYFGFGNGTVTLPSQNIQTNTDKDAREDDALTYTALSTKAFDGEPVKRYFEGSADFDEPTMYKEVFGGFAKALPPVGGSAVKGGKK